MQPHDLVTDSSAKRASQRLPPRTHLDHAQRLLVVWINGLELEQMPPESVERMILELRDGGRHGFLHQISLDLHVLFHFQEVSLKKVIREDD